MKKINGKFVPSATDIKRAQAHARAIAKSRSYDGCIDVYFDAVFGRFEYHELVGNGYILPNNPEEYQFVYSAECRSWN